MPPAVPAVAPHGEDLLGLIQSRLPQLSPAMRSIGAFCVRRHAGLHQMSIDEVAGQCGTVPSSLVRFARLFGHRGFQDLKLAFLGQPVRPEPAPLAMPDTAPTARPGWLGQLDEDVYQLSALRDLLLGEVFGAALDWIRAETRLVLTYEAECDRLAAMHLGDALQRAGKIVLLADPSLAVSTPAWQAGAIRIHLDLDRPGRHLSQTLARGPSPDGTDGRRIDLPGCDRLVRPLATRHAQTLPVFGSSLGRRVQKALSVAGAIESALRTAPLPGPHRGRWNA